MSLIAREPEGSNIPPLPEGVYVGTCYLLADIGEQYNKLNESWKQKVIIGWEINGESITIDGKEEPRTICGFYGNSLHEKSTLRKILECWRGKRFTPEELAGFDLRKIVGTACQLQIAHTIKDDGKVRADVKSIVALTRGMGYEPPTQKIIFDMDTDLDKLETMPKIVQTMVGKSRAFSEQEETPFGGEQSHFDEYGFPEPPPDELPL